MVFYDVRCMSQVPESEIRQLLNLSGYDQMLEIDRICRQYGVEEETLRQLMVSFSSPPPVETATQPAATYDPTPEHLKTPPQTPVFQQSSPTYIDKKQFHFDYDPSVEAKQRRSLVDQAIVCPACGVALGIPSQRPIKVTCPQCLHEALFQQ